MNTKIRELADALSLSRSTLSELCPDPSDKARVEVLLALLKREGVSSLSPISPRFLRIPLTSGSSLFDALRLQQLDEKDLQTLVSQAWKFSEAARSQQQEREERLREAGFQEIFCQKGGRMKELEKRQVVPFDAIHILDNASFSEARVTGLNDEEHLLLSGFVDGGRDLDIETLDRLLSVNGRVFSIEDEVREKRRQLMDELDRRVAQNSTFETIYRIAWTVE